jgi:hypothetical protein
MTKVELLNALLKIGACDDALEYVCRTTGTAKEIYLACINWEWLEWLYIELNLNYEIHFFDDLEGALNEAFFQLDACEEIELVEAEIIKLHLPKIRLSWPLVERTLINFITEIRKELQDD